ncbi:TPA: hypothetical protein HA234_05475, partial [Candidatus Woesearchaeota archaeon]|nr:hypothetical protein [Candidatus Woesearchaeota archaeon]
VRNGRLAVRILGDFVHGEHTYVSEEEQVELIKIIMDLQGQANGFIKIDGVEIPNPNNSVFKVIKGNHEAAEWGRVKEQKTGIWKGGILAGPHQGVAPKKVYRLADDIMKWFEKLPLSDQEYGIDFAHAGPFEGMNEGGKELRNWDKRWYSENDAVKDRLKELKAEFGIYGHVAGFLHGMEWPDEKIKEGVRFAAGRQAAIIDVNRDGVGFVELVRKGNNWILGEKLNGKERILKEDISLKESSSAIVVPRPEYFPLDEINTEHIAEAFGINIRPENVKALQEAVGSRKLAKRANLQEEYLRIYKFIEGFTPERRSYLLRISNRILNGEKISADLYHGTTGEKTVLESVVKYGLLSPQEMDRLNVLAMTGEMSYGKLGEDEYGSVHVSKKFSYAFQYAGRRRTLERMKEAFNTRWTEEKDLLHINRVEKQYSLLEKAFIEDLGLSERLKEAPRVVFGISESQTNEHKIHPERIGGVIGVGDITHIYIENKGKKEIEALLKDVAHPVEVIALEEIYSLAEFLNGVSQRVRVGSANDLSIWQSLKYDAEVQDMFSYLIVGDIDKFYKNNPGLARLLLRAAVKAIESIQQASNSSQQNSLPLRQGQQPMEKATTDNNSNGVNGAGAGSSSAMVGELAVINNNPVFVGTLLEQFGNTRETGRESGLRIIVNEDGSISQTLPSRFNFFTFTLPEPSKNVKVKEGQTIFNIHTHPFSSNTHFLTSVQDFLPVNNALDELVIVGWQPPGSEVPLLVISPRLSGGRQASLNQSVWPNLIKNNGGGFFALTKDGIKEIELDEVEATLNSSKLSEETYWKELYRLKAAKDIGGSVEELGNVARNLLTYAKEDDSLGNVYKQWMKEVDTILNQQKEESYFDALKYYEKGLEDARSQLKAIFDFRLIRTEIEAEKYAAQGLLLLAPNVLQPLGEVEAIYNNYSAIVSRVTTLLDELKEYDNRMTFAALAQEAYKPKGFFSRFMNKDEPPAILTEKAVKEIVDTFNSETPKEDIRYSDDFFSRHMGEFILQKIPFDVLQKLIPLPSLEEVTDNNPGRIKELENNETKRQQLRSMPFLLHVDEDNHLRMFGMNSLPWLLMNMGEKTTKKDISIYIPRAEKEVFMTIVSGINGSTGASNTQSTDTTRLPLPLVPRSTNAPDASSSLGGNSGRVVPSVVGSLVGITSSSISAAGGVNTTMEGLAASIYTGSLKGAGGIGWAAVSSALTSRLPDISARIYEKIRALLDKVSVIGDALQEVLRTFGAIVGGVGTTEQTASGSPVAGKGLLAIETTIVENQAAQSAVIRIEQG